MLPSRAEPRDVLRQAESEGLTLLKSTGNASGYKFVSHGYFSHDGSRNFQAWVMRGGAQLTLGFFATAEEAALCVARSPEGRAAGSVSAPLPGPTPMTAQEALQKAEAEGLTLMRSASRNTGYEGVYLNHVNYQKTQGRRFSTTVWREGKMLTLGYYVTAEEVLPAPRLPPPRHPVASGTPNPNHPHTIFSPDSHPSPPLPLPSAPPPSSALLRPRLTRVLSARAQHAQAALEFARSPEGRAAALQPPPPPAPAPRAPPPLPPVRRSVHESMPSPKCAEKIKVVRGTVLQNQGQLPEQPPMSAEEARQAAEAEGLSLLRGTNQTGYKWVVHDKYRDSGTPYQAKVWQGERRGGSYVTLGSFGTAEEAALCYARWAAAQGPAAGLPRKGYGAKRKAEADAARPSTPPKMTAEEAVRLAEEEGLTLVRSESSLTGYRNVSFKANGCKNTSLPFQAKVQRGDKQVYLGIFATAEEGALCVARDARAEAARQSASLANAAATARRALPPPMRAASESAASQPAADSSKRRKVKSEEEQEEKEVGEEKEPPSMPHWPIDKRAELEFDVCRILQSKLQAREAAEALLIM